MILNLTEIIFTTILYCRFGIKALQISQGALSGQKMKIPAVAFKNVQPD